MGKKKHNEFFSTLREAWRTWILQHNCKKMYEGEEEEEGKKRAHWISLDAERSPTGFLLSTTLKKGMIDEEQEEKEKEEKEIKKKKRRIMKE